MAIRDFCGKPFQAIDLEGVMELDSNHDLTYLKFSTSYEYEVISDMIHPNYVGNYIFDISDIDRSNGLTRQVSPFLQILVSYNNTLLIANEKQIDKIKLLIDNEYNTQILSSNSEFGKHYVA